MDKPGHKQPDALPPPQDALGLDPSARQPAAPQPPSIGGMIKRTMAHWYIAVIVAILGAGATVFVVKNRKPAYRSEAVVNYREGVRAASFGPDGPDPLRTLANKLKDTLLSRSNLEKVVSEFNLFPDVVEKRGMVDAVDRLRGKITGRSTSPETFVISYEGATREEAQEVTQRLAELLVENHTRMRQAQAKKTTDFLDDEQRKAEQEVDEAEKELARFLAEHPEFAAEQVQPGGAQAGASIRAEQRKASEGDPTLDALERQAMRLRSQRTAAAAPAAGGPAAAPAPPPALVQAKQQADQELAAARRDLAEKQARFTEQHPDVKNAQAREAVAAAAAARAAQELDAATRAAAAAPAGDGTDPYADTTPREAELAKQKAQLSKVEREIADRKKAAASADRADPSDTAQQIIGTEGEWSRLTREQLRARQRLEELAPKVFRAKIAANSEQGGYAAQIEVRDPAYKPTVPSTMSRSKMALAGLVASIAVGLGLAAARGILLDDRIFDAEDVDRLALGPVLAIVPHAPRRRWWRRG